MHRKLDTTRPRSRPRIAPAVATLITCTTLAAGCSDAPKPEDQREQMVVTTRTVIEGLVDQLEMADPAVVDDGSETVSCPDGVTQFRCIVYGITDIYSTYTDDIDGALDVLNDTVHGLVAGLPDGATYSGGDDIEGELPRAVSTPGEP